MRTQELDLVGTESAVSNDACGLAGNPIALTYTQIASLFHQYREELTRRLIGMVKSRETAADLGQDVYLRLLRLSDQHLVEQPRALLHKIATNLAIDHLRNEKYSIQGLDYQELQLTADELVARLAGHPGFVTPQMDAALNTPHLTVETHRDKSADLGVSVASIGRTLKTLLSGRPVNTFMQNGRQYKVIVKVDDRHREKPSDISQRYVRGNGGVLVQLNNIVTVKEVPTPEALNHVDRMRAVTVGAGLADGFTLGQALNYLDETSRDIIKSGMRTAYAGESKTFAESNCNLYLTFVLALAVIFLVLAAQFESFRHPWTILLTVPPALSGSLLSLAAIDGTLTIYSQIGLVILIGLVSKNAILIVEFANQLRARGMNVSDAVIEAAVLRLRPILMTTCVTILGALPLALATGAGAAGRRQIGIVLIGGLLVSTLVTLVLVPAGYRILSRDVKVSEAERTKSP